MYSAATQSTAHQPARHGREVQNIFNNNYQRSAQRRLTVFFYQSLLIVRYRSKREHGRSQQLLSNRLALLKPIIIHLYKITLLNNTANSEFGSMIFH